MGRQLVTEGFDYSQLERADATALEDHAGKIVQIQDHVRKVGAEGVIAIGRELKAAHDRLASHDKTKGVFGKWVEERCGFSRMTAHKAIRAFDAFGCCKPSLQHIDPTAMYLLSAPDTDGDVRQRAIELAESGETVTHARARQLIEELGESGENGLPFDGYAAKENVIRYIRRTLGKWPDDMWSTMLDVFKELAKEIKEQIRKDAEG